MNAGRPAKSNWLTQNYDKLFLIVVLVALLGSALVLVLRTGMERSELAQAKWERPAAQKDVAPLDLAQLQEMTKPLSAPFQSAPSSNAMMVSELRVSCVNPSCGRPIPYYAETCPFCGVAQPEIPTVDKIDKDQDQLPDVYETEHGLDPSNADDAMGDKDGDGFNNLEEYQAGTNPTDAADFPDLPAKLRVIGARSQPFILRFQGINELSNGKVFLLNLRSLERSYFVKLGDEVEGFKVFDFKPDAPEGPTLTLQKGSALINLVKGIQLDRHEIVCKLVFLLDRSTYTVKIGDSIKLRDRVYKIVDIKQNTVSISDVGTGKVYQVSPLTDSERRALTGEPEPAVSAGGVHL